MKPILMNTENVRAILDGRKTVTRRVIKGVPNRADLQPYDVMGSKGLIASNSRVYTFKPPYQVGDELYVKETFANIRYTDGNSRFVYKATDTYPFGENYIVKFQWHPSIHMPKEAARIFLRVTDVRVERLQDITDEQAWNEGCTGEKCSNCFGFGCGDCWGSGWQEPPIVEFIDTWDSTIKKSDLDKYGWNASPWVWVIEFKRISEGEAQ